MKFSKVALIGCGLMGGSFALAARRAGWAPHIVGYSASASSRQKALSMGVIDLAVDSMAEAVTDADLRAILAEGRRRGLEDGRETVHGAPVSFTVDATPGVEDPRGMICDTLGARVHLVDASQAALRNLGACLGRCDLEVEELVSAPLASGLATLVEDEKRIGATLIDMGGGTTSIAVFSEGQLIHTAQIPVGGWQVTNDLARVLSTPISHAERLKTLHGGALALGGFLLQDALWAKSCVQMFVL